MAISTQTEALIELYNQKNSLDSQQLSQVALVQGGYNIKTGIGTTEQIKIWGVNEVIANYDTPIEKLDDKIVEINNQINTLQLQLLSLGQEANLIGCGVDPLSFLFYSFATVLFLLFSGRSDLFSGILPEDIVVVYKDTLRYRGYTYLSPNPFETINGTLVSVASSDSQSATALVSNGRVTSISVVNAGKGYVSAPSVTIASPLIQSAVGVATTGAPGIVTAINVSNAGYGYTQAPSVSIQPPTVIGPGIGTTATATAYVSVGVVTGFEVTNPGYGYTFTPTVTLSSVGFGTTATATSTIDSNGRLQSITVVNPGSNYITTPIVYVGTPGDTAGLGTETYVDSVSIGIYIDPIGTCIGLSCDSGTCTGYATSISNLNSQITTLRTQRNNLITKVNILKAGKSGYELQNYAYNESTAQLNQSIAVNNALLSFFQDPANDEWL
jgi:hypothetical protein